MDETSSSRRLTKDEQMIGHEILTQVRQLITEASDDDAELIWALRRFVYARLMYDERGKPMERKKLKTLKIKSQNGVCALCAATLPERGTVLDRFAAMKGYTEENTRVLCASCDAKVQVSRKFA